MTSNLYNFAHRWHHFFMPLHWVVVVLSISIAYGYESPEGFTLPLIDTLSAFYPPPMPSVPQLGRLISNIGFHFAADLLNNGTCSPPDILHQTKLQILPFTDFNIQSVVIQQMIALSEKSFSLVIGLPAPETASPAAIVGDVFDVAQLSSFSPASHLSDTRTYPYFSRVALNTQTQAQTIHDFLLHNENQFGLGWTNVAVLSTITAYTIDYASSFIATAPSGITIAQYRQFLVDEEEIDVELKEVQKSGARVILALVTDNYASFIGKANASGLVGDDYVWLVSPATVGLSFFSPVPLAQGTIASLNYFPPEANYLRCFVQAWKTADPVQYPFAGGGKMPTLGAMLSYDTIMVAAYAIDRLDQMEMLDGRRIAPSLWNEAIRNVTFDGLSGNLSFRENGDRIGTTSLQYYNADKNQFELAAIRTEEDGVIPLMNITWFSNTTNVPDLDIRPPFSYWSCKEGEEDYDPTGKTIQLQTPGSSDVDEIEIDYHCDQFIDCQNFSDETKNCASNYLVAFIVFGILTGLLILVAVLLIVFVLLFGNILNYRRIRTASPVFLILMLVSIIIGYSSVFAFYGKPHPVACAFQPWLLGLPSISMIATLVVKNFRIWRIFRFPLRRTSISDLELFVLWGIIMVPALVTVILWTIISTPTASLQHVDGNEHYVCATGGFTGPPGGLIFFIVFAVYGAIVLLMGTIVSILARNVPSLFNESKLLTISIYNLGFLSVVIIPVFLVLRSIDPFIAWIIRTFAVLYAFSATMFLQFAPKVIGVLIIDKGRNARPQGTMLSQSSTTARSSRSTKQSFSLSTNE